MSPTRWLMAMMSFSVLTGCAPKKSASGMLSAAHEAALADSVEGVLRQYASSWERATCDNADAVLRFFDWSDPGQLDISETDIALYSGDSWPRYIQSLACARSEAITVDSIVVRVFGPDVASVAWTFVATYGDTSGVAHQGRGTVLQVWHRTSEGWRSSVGMGAHQPMPESASRQ